MALTSHSVGLMDGPALGPDSRRAPHGPSRSSLLLSTPFSFGGCTES